MAYGRLRRRLGGVGEGSVRWVAVPSCDLRQMVIDMPGTRMDRFNLFAASPVILDVIC